MKFNKSNTDIFYFIKENFHLANSDIPANFKSAHWNTFNDNFDQLIESNYIWDHMLRNALTLGFNDSLLEISNQRFSADKRNLWAELRSGELQDLISESTDKTTIQNQKRILSNVIGASEHNDSVCR